MQHIERCRTTLADRTLGMDGQVKRTSRSQRERLMCAVVCITVLTVLLDECVQRRACRNETSCKSEAIAGTVMTRAVVNAIDGAMLSLHRRQHPGRSDW